MAHSTMGRMPATQEGSVSWFIVSSSRRATRRLASVPASTSTRPTSRIWKASSSSTSPITRRGGGETARCHIISCKFEGDALVCYYHCPCASACRRGALRLRAGRRLARLARLDIGLQPAQLLGHAVVAGGCEFVEAAGSITADGVGPGHLGLGALGRQDQGPAAGGA